MAGLPAACGTQDADDVIVHGECASGGRWVRVSSVWVARDGLRDVRGDALGGGDP